MRCLLTAHDTQESGPVPPARASIQAEKPLASAILQEALWKQKDWEDKLEIHATSLNILEEKGWHLYRALPEQSFKKKVCHGKCSSVQLNTPYVLLPATCQDDSWDEVRAQMHNALDSNQRPIHNDNRDAPSDIEFIVFSKSGMSVKTKDEMDVYFYSGNQIVDVVKYYISNYNVKYFSRISDVRSHLEYALGGLHEQLTTSAPSQPRWEYVRSDSDSDAPLRIYPSNPSPFLFRGQNRRYRPSYPSTSRNLTSKTNALKECSEDEKATLTFNLIRTEWFNKLLSQTPALQWLKEQGIAFDETAVAQHYGLPTGYMDLSQSFDVAAFFACCKYDAETNRWCAVGEGEGVVHMVDWRETPFDGPVKPIFLQPFPRPSEQWAWVHEMILGMDFEKLGYVRKFVFQHDIDESESILAQFDKGAALFPPDPLAVVADKVKVCQSIPMTIAIEVVENLIKDPSGLPGEQLNVILAMIEQEMKVKFSNSSRLLEIDHRIMQQLARNWKTRKNSFAQNRDVTIRLARTVFSRPEGDRQKWNRA